MNKHKKKVVGLTEGMRLEVFSEGRVFIFSGILSKIDKDAIWITDVNGSDVPFVIYNSKVRLKGTLRDGSAVILLGTVCGSNAQFWKVGQLFQHRFYNKRNYYRHSVSIKTTAARLVYEPEVSGGIYRLAPFPAVPCKVLNISGGGLMFYSRTRFFINTCVQMGLIVLLPDYEPFSLRCRILRIIDDKGRYFCGCRFIGLAAKERERLIRAVFLLQTEEIRKKVRQNR